MQVINQDSNGNINMLLIGGDAQWDGKVKVVSPEMSDRVLEVFVKPEGFDKCSPCIGDGTAVAKASSITKDHYYPEKFYMGNTVMKFYRHNSLTASQAYIKLFSGYKGGSNV
jgi:hypothetical protein